MRALPGRVRQAVRMRVAKIPWDLVIALECAMSTQEMGRGERMEPEWITWHEQPQQSPPQPATDTSSAQSLPLVELIPTESDQRAPLRASKPWLTGSAHRQSLTSPHMTTLQINGSLMTVLLDSGSTITLVWFSSFPKAVQPCSKLSMTCVHGDIWEVPAAEVWIGGQ